MFRRYTDEGASIADLARWLTEQNVPTRTGKPIWDRSVIWAMLRNPAYAGTAMFGKTISVQQPAGINRAARLAGRSTPTAHKTIERPREEWTAIAVPAIITEQTFARAEQRLADNKRFAARNTKIPSLLQVLTACAGGGYAYYLTSTSTTNRKVFYNRCLARTTTATRRAGLRQHPGPGRLSRPGRLGPRWWCTRHLTPESAESAH
jgi:site-specific DNA recombinase